MTFTIPFTLSFAIYGLPGYDTISASEIEATGGGRGPPLTGTENAKSLFLVPPEKMKRESLGFGE